MLISRFWTTSKICDRMCDTLQCVTPYNTEIFSPDKWSYLFFVHIIFETFSSLYVSSILMRTAAWRSRALQILSAYWVLLRIYCIISDKNSVIERCLCMAGVYALLKYLLCLQRQTVPDLHWPPYSRWIHACILWGSRKPSAAGGRQ